MSTATVWVLSRRQRGPARRYPRAPRFIGLLPSTFNAVAVALQVREVFTCPTWIESLDAPATRPGIEAHDRVYGFAPAPEVLA